jgi:hypothetical protein
MAGDNSPDGIGTVLKASLTSATVPKIPADGTDESAVCIGSLSFPGASRAGDDVEVTRGCCCGDTGCF